MIHNIKKKRSSRGEYWSFDLLLDSPCGPVLVRGWQWWPPDDRSREKILAPRKRLHGRVVEVAAMSEETRRGILKSARDSAAQLESTESRMVSDDGLVLLMEQLQRGPLEPSVALRGLVDAGTLGPKDVERLGEMLEEE